ncbi:CoA pyrophosphatase [Mesorhizobium sp. YR577]|jgi:8-oxo-dGTP pyrophosphatase MutT (NUDIX family)|uniref:CoA pyrophosphatase n=1 Tax=Mesorhizobium sp. YR577 TaxID=1884373 RepID=UPI0008F37285|nr:CoA pyrophosphatase [Mesorhizobium sp. YR577]SFU20063.1 NUDIX domain-containing protein [Mesorhizobium sp. YR577]
MDNAVATHFSALDFRRRVEREREPEPDPDYGDHRFNPGFGHLIRRDNLRDAAVLIPVVDHGDEASVILTKRTEKLRNHSGQVAFPGGRIDPTDPTPEFAALRETIEEIGLGEDHVEVVGRMPDYVAGSGYRIAPVLGIVRPGFHLTINPHEVDTAFEVPLRFLMDPANHHQSSRMWNDKEWVFYDMPYGGQRIWGVTAGIIRTLYERLYA